MTPNGKEVNSHRSTPDMQMQAREQENDGASGEIRSLNLQLFSVSGRL
jgi:hypothetical protein